MDSKTYTDEVTQLQHWKEAVVDSITIATEASERVEEYRRELNSLHERIARGEETIRTLDEGIRSLAEDEDFTKDEKERYTTEVLERKSKALEILANYRRQSRYREQNLAESIEIKERTITESKDLIDEIRRRVGVKIGKITTDLAVESMAALEAGWKAFIESETPSRGR